MRTIHPKAWGMMFASAVLQVVIFPLPNLYFLSWIAIFPLLLALLNGRRPKTLQFTEGSRLLPCHPWQGFILGYACGILWYAGTCYWVYDTMHRYGGLSIASAMGVLVLFCLYLGLYHGIFGLTISLMADRNSFSRSALLVAPAAWVAIELARTRISGFPWNLLGIAQVDNIPLSRISTFTGVYGLSFEIVLVNAAFAAALLVRREKKNALLLAAASAAIVLQAGSLMNPAPFPTDRVANLVQANIPVLDQHDWTHDYFETTLRELIQLSGNTSGNSRHPALIVWPESPAPFYENDPTFQAALSTAARANQSWLLGGDIGAQRPGQPSDHVFNSVALVSPAGDWTGHYDKVHLVPFGEYVPFQRVFSFAGGLTEQVGDFSAGTSRAPLIAGDAKLGVFLCYESIFPDEIRRFAKNGAQVFVNLSNDGWYGDSGAFAQHLKQSRMRAVENARWLLLDTNTGVTASADPYGRIVASVPRKIRTVLQAPFALSSETTFYTRHGDWFAYLCAIISLLALLTRLPFIKRKIATLWPENSNRNTQP